MRRILAVLTILILLSSAAAADGANPFSWLVPAVTQDTWGMPTTTPNPWLQPVQTAVPWGQPPTETPAYGWVQQTPVPGYPDNPASQRTENGFTFRNGVTWDMSPEQVSAIEILPLSGRNNGRWSILASTQKAGVSLFVADLVYIFRDNRLKMICYDFGTEGNAESYEYLAGALESIYGESSVPNAGEIVNIMEQIYPGRYSVNSIIGQKAWHRGTDTSIYLHYYQPNAYSILYVYNGSSVPPGGYITTGL